MPDSLFTRIVNRELPADIVYEDEQCIAINDVNPKAPIHILLIPKKPLVNLADAGAEDQQLLGHLMAKAADIAREHQCGDAFRVVINNGEGAGQTVFHLHIHILAGREMSWPPG